MVRWDQPVIAIRIVSWVLLQLHIMYLYQYSKIPHCHGVIESWSLDSRRTFQRQFRYDFAFIDILFTVSRTTYGILYNRTLNLVWNEFCAETCYLPQRLRGNRCNPFTGINPELL